MDKQFKLSEQFIKQYVGQQPEWGPLGYITYKRTYSRELPDGSTEEWWQTCKRVVEGVFELQRRHINYLQTRWDAVRAQKSGQEMYKLMWEFKFLPAGRGLAQMGGPLVMDEGNGAVLLNCAFVSTEEIGHDFSSVFCFLFSASAHGIGCGFDTLGTGKATIVEPRITSNVVIIDDTREAWVDSMRVVLDAYVGIGAVPVFDYSKIRPKGSKIKRFGGTASGPESLQTLLECDLPTILTPGKITSTQITDVMNCIGKCVVAGGARRSAEIALGSPEDDDFIHLKDDYEKVKEYRWASNNSVICDANYKDYEKFVKPIMTAGEPGFVFIDNCKSYARINGHKDDRDLKAKGVNPSIQAA